MSGCGVVEEMARAIEVTPGNTGLSWPEICESFSRAVARVVARRLREALDEPTDGTQGCTVRRVRALLAELEGTR